MDTDDTSKRFAKCVNNVSLDGNFFLKEASTCSNQVADLGERVFCQVAAFAHSQIQNPCSLKQICL